MLARCHFMLAATLALMLVPALASEAGSGEPNYGTSSCPCIDWDSTRYESDGAIQIELGGVTYPYPLNFGEECLPHDQGMRPYCDEATIDEVPEWCAQPWCYVDKDVCDHPASKSSYFPEAALSYSYRTCGGSNTFDAWFGDNAAASGSHELTDIIDTVEGYLKSITHSLELDHYELSKTPATCAADLDCDCTTCQSGQGQWQPQEVDYQKSTLTVRLDVRTSPLEHVQESMRLDECLTNIVGGAFTRVAAIEADVTRLGYMYYASQELGNYLQWPGHNWCPDAYDPRFRPWYAVGASGPKDIVVVIDTSGSMNSGRRIALAKQAAKTVLGTLTESDYGGVIAFSSAAEAYSPTLLPGTLDNIAAMQAWIDGLSATGSTDYVDAFGTVWSMFAASEAAGATAECNRAVLFLTDGEPDAWGSDDFAALAAEAAAQGEGFHLMTYALGDGISRDAKARLKRLACENRGVAYVVSDADADNGELDTTMARYYDVLSPNVQPCQPRWNSYIDVLSNTELLAACLPAYALLDDGSATSCEGGLGGLGEPDDARVPRLLGVACVDINLLVSLETIRARDDYPAFEARVREEQAACPRTTVSELQLETLRFRVSAEAVCDADFVSPEAAPAPPPSNSTDGGGGGAVAGVIGGVVGGLVALCLCFYARRMSADKRARRPAAAAQPPMVQGTAMPTYAQAAVPMGRPVYDP